MQNTAFLDLPVRLASHSIVFFVSKMEQQTSSYSSHRDQYDGWAQQKQADLPCGDDINFYSTFGLASIDYNVMPLVSHSDAEPALGQEPSMNYANCWTETPATTS